MDRDRVPSGAALLGAIVPIWIATALAYAPAMHGPFFFDDAPAIVDNESIRSLTPIHAALVSPPDRPTSGRPVANLSFALNYAAGGLEPFGYRLVNLALHMACALLLAAVVRRLLGRPVVSEALRAARGPLALATAALWALHPLASEAVLYVTQRTDVLAALFSLAATYAAIRAFESETPRRWTLAAFGAVLLGIGSKEWAAVTPFVVAAIDRGYYTASWRDVARLHRGFYRAMLGALAVGGLLVVSTWAEYAALGGAAVGTRGGVSPWQYLGTQAGVLLRYLVLVVWPAKLSVSHYVPIAERLTDAWPQGLLVLALLALTLVLFRARPWLALSGALFFLVLAPTSSIIPIVNEVAAERRMYLPLAGFVATGLGLAWALFARLRMSPALAAAALVLVTTAAALRTRARAAEYESRIAIWGAAVAADPRDPTARIGLAEALRDEGRVAEAISHAELVTRMRFEHPGVQPWRRSAHTLLGGLAERKGDFGTALRHYETALALDPTHYEARLNRGLLQLALGDHAAAVRDFEVVVRAGPERARALALNNLGLAHLKAGELDRAVEHLTRAHALRPADVGTLNNLAQAFARRGQWEPALAAIEEALRLAPGDATTLANKARLLAHRGAAAQE